MADALVERQGFVGQFDLTAHGLFGHDGVDFRFHLARRRIAGHEHLANARQGHQPFLQFLRRHFLPGREDDRTRGATGDPHEPLFVDSPIIARREPPLAVKDVCCPHRLLVVALQHGRPAQLENAVGRHTRFHPALAVAGLPRTAAPVGIDRFDGVEGRRLRQTIPAERLDAQRHQQLVRPSRTRRPANDDPVKRRPQRLLRTRPVLGDFHREQFRQRGHEEEVLRPETFDRIVDTAEVGADAERHAVSQHHVRRADAEDVVKRQKHQRTVTLPDVQLRRGKIRKRTNAVQRQFRAARLRRRTAREDDHRRLVLIAGRLIKDARRTRLQLLVGKRQQPVRHTGTEPANHQVRQQFLDGLRLLRVENRMDEELGAGEDQTFRQFFG